MPYCFLHVTNVGKKWSRVTEFYLLGFFGGKGLAALRQGGDAMVTRGRSKMFQKQKKCVNIEQRGSCLPFLWVSENCMCPFFLSEICRLETLSEIWLPRYFLSEIWRPPKNFAPLCGERKNWSVKRRKGGSCHTNAEVLTRRLGGLWHVHCVRGRGVKKVRWTIYFREKRRSGKDWIIHTTVVRARKNDESTKNNLIDWRGPWKTINRL